MKKSTKEMKPISNSIDNTTNNSIISKHEGETGHEYANEQTKTKSRYQLKKKQTGTR